MNWETIFQRNDAITVDNAKNLLADSASGELLFLDVRLPQEFRDNHLPGAKNIPLNDLLLRLNELSPEQQMIVYCRSGARSNAACQLLRANGFTKVLNLTGGISSWQGHTARGSESAGLDFFLGADYDHAIAMAYAMEEGLQEFYRILAKNSADAEMSALLVMMQKFEDGHKAKLSVQYRRKTGRDLQPAPAPPVLEGGLSMEDLWDTFGDQVRSPEAVLELAMGFEAQAYDLYLRLSRSDKEQEVRDFYLHMAGEELKHLERLTRELEKYLNRPDH
jgi:rhodanese-related sulfurtransferase/rubrerythrin